MANRSSMRARTLAHAQRPHSPDTQRTLHKDLLKSVEGIEESRAGELEG